MERKESGKRGKRKESGMRTAGHVLPGVPGHSHKLFGRMSLTLSRVSDFLMSQTLRLLAGENINSLRLSHYASTLLSLQEEDREMLLQAHARARRASPLIDHCLGVSIRLTDLAGRFMPRQLRQSIMAAALVHDLGKVLLPATLLDQTEWREHERILRLPAHIALLHQRLGSCRWLAVEVCQQVIVQINERLDGSGYPEGLRGGQLRQLARLAAVVDVVDAMGRARPGRAAYPIEEIYDYLLSRPHMFDQRWVKQYIRYFGTQPLQVDGHS